ncbi:MAG: hypothetical protein K0U41_02305 [Gammaproteobacteria bacterium]|nr:hypothetical protein [Gammaproteobacteria bacterium]
MAGFLDGIIRPFRRTTVPPTETVGRPGTAIYSGYIQPIEKDAKLIGREKYRTYSEILANTSIAAAGVRYFLNLASRVSWKVAPAEINGVITSDSQRLADTVEFMMGDMETPWHRVVRRAAMYRFLGFSMQEWTAKRNADGTTGFLDVAARPQVTIERWDTRETGEVAGVIQRSRQFHDEIYIPRSKLIYVVDDTLTDSPEGLGLFRHIVEPVKRLQRFEQLESFGFETDLRGVPVGKVPFAELEKAVLSGDLTVEEKDAKIAGLMNFIKNHIKNPQLGILLDSITYQSLDEAGTPSTVPQWDVDLLRGTATGSSQQDVATAIERLNREIARVLGIEGLLLGETNHGSMALSSDKSHNFALIIDSTLTELTESFSKDFLNPLWTLNGWPEDLKPTFKTDAVQYRDIRQVTGALRDLAMSGIPLTPDDPAVTDLRDLMGISKPNLDSMLTDLTVGGNNGISAGDE